MRKKIKRFNPINALNIATNIRDDLSAAHHELMRFLSSRDMATIDYELARIPEKTLNKMNEQTKLLRTITGKLIQNIKEELMKTRGY